ncbi:hypothetical protein ACX80D_10195 [Arthrobacter sp. Sr24]
MPEFVPEFMPEFMTVAKPAPVLDSEPLALSAAAFAGLPKRDDLLGLDFLAMGS